MAKTKSTSPVMIVPKTALYIRALDLHLEKGKPAEIPGDEAAQIAEKIVNEMKLATYHTPDSEVKDGTNN